MSVDALREQLRERGYLTHGIERWFALDPWSSRAFWLELTLVAAKAAALIALFAALPLTAITVLRNVPVGAFETLALFASYAAATFLAAFALVVTIAWILKLRPALPVDTPRALLAISMGAAALIVGAIALWWFRFDAPPETLELVAGVVLTTVLFLVATIVVSAALLSFSIYEIQRIPAIHQKGRGIPLSIAAVCLVPLLFLPALVSRETAAADPMVVTTPSNQRVALVGVDGLTLEILQSRPDLAFLQISAAAPVPGRSTTERWATVGSGVRTTAHGVRAIEGVRFRGSEHVLQRTSRGDLVVMRAAPLLGLARREPLPPTVRRRDYAWEVVAGRGVPAVAVNWWATGNERLGGLTSVGPETIFTASRGDALAVDAMATRRLFSAIDQHQPQLAVVYLPALDVILNRLTLDRTAQLTQSLRALEGIAGTVIELKRRGYEVLVIGLPGDAQSGAPVLASTRPLITPRTAWDVVPTLLDLLGFPLSDEMPGKSLAAQTSEPRIATYGNRKTQRESPKLNEEYYENLRSLGYIR